MEVEDQEMGREEGKKGRRKRQAKASKGKGENK